MDRANTIGMLISALFIATTLGIVSGLIWGFALNFQITSGLKIGGVSGLVVGLLFFLFQKASTDSGNLQKKEVVFASGSILGVLFMISTAIAIVAGLIKWIFL